MKGKHKGHHDEAAPRPESLDTGEQAGKNAAEAAVGGNDEQREAKGQDGKAPGEPLCDREALLRLSADFDNFRKRSIREKTEIYQRANEDIVLELLPVLDHFELALSQEHTKDVPGEFIKGISLVYEQLMAALRKFGLEPVESAGRVFNPNFHEAVSHIPSDEIPADHVIVQIRPGYMLGSRLLRPAQAVVSSGKAGECPGEAGETVDNGGGGDGCKD